MEPLFVFAPGAGASSSHPWMRHWATQLGKIGVVRTFDYPYMIEGSRRPNPLPQLIAAHREALQQAQQCHDGPVFLIGKSMGSRIGCHLSLQEKVAGLICLGYPLCGGGSHKNERQGVARIIYSHPLRPGNARPPLSVGIARTSARRNDRG